MTTVLVLVKLVPSSMAMFPSLRQSVSNDWYVGEVYTCVSGKTLTSALQSSKGPHPEFSSPCTLNNPTETVSWTHLPLLNLLLSWISLKNELT